MTVRDNINAIKAQITLGRTFNAYCLSEKAKDVLNATLDDEKNLDADVLQCKNCGLLMSSLHSSDGCPNCNGLDLKSDIGSL